MKIILPILFLACALSLAGIFYSLKPEAAETEVEQAITRVEVTLAQPETINLAVRSQGTVLPKTESTLSSEVTGRILYTSENFAAGASFRAGEILLKIDPADYKAALATRRAELANAELQLAQEEALAEQALADWESIGSGQPSALVLRKPQLKQASAQIESAKAALRKAERDLERTSIKAPFDGKVLQKSVDLGQIVSANPPTAVAQIYATDLAEIRLPITMRERRFLEDPTRSTKRVHLFTDGPEEPEVRIGTLKRFEGSIDTSTRLLYAVAEVEDPFQTDAQTGGAPLLRGLFVDAEIEGRSIDQAYSIPQYALRGSDTVYIYNPNGSLETRQVTVIKSDSQRAIITEGLQAGDQIVTSGIAYYVEGMPAEIFERK